MLAQIESNIVATTASIAQEAATAPISTKINRSKPESSTSLG